MTTQEIAYALVNYCRKGEFNKAYDELYSKDIVSIEPDGSPAPLLKGMEAVLQKSKQFEAMIEEYHANEVSDPIVADHFFSCSMKMDVTFKGAPRSIMEEICLYQVEDGKIVQEQFFYSPDPNA